MLLSLLLDFQVIQIPVNYLPRIGESSVTGDLRKAILLGLTMIGLVLRYRLRSWLGRSAPSMRGEGAP
jgi:dolichol-phosphate mannosyltransferase